MAAQPASSTSASTGRRPNWMQDDPGRVHRAVEHVLTHAPSGDPEAVLAAIEEFSRSAHLMIVGPAKGETVEAKMREIHPRYMAELGGFIGYSAVKFGRLLPTSAEDGSGGGRYVTFEKSAEYAALARRVIAHAGLQDRCVILEGAFEDSWPRLRSELGIQALDALFIDHAKEAYLPDFKLVEEHGLVRPGGVVLADNVLVPGAPDYLAYVSAGGRDGTFIARHELFRHRLGANGEREDAISVAYIA
ncbi:hypothetical protein HK405_012997 [Cladochytrium tenue]|nr:hypothetical protein HK405_012997 [Cladochytrium tenue]